MEAQEKCCENPFKVLASGEFILPPLLQESVNRIVEKEGYITHKVLNRSISTSGGNYLADLYEVDIRGKTAEGDKEINIFIKNKIEDAISIISLDGAYSTETFFYDELSPIYTNLQNKANIPLEERYAMAKSYDASNPDAIILENLAKKGFSTCERMEVVPLKFAELSVQQLARFHGLSWVLEKQQPDFFSKRIVSMKMAFRLNDDFKGFLANMANFTRNFLDSNKAEKLDEYVSGAVEKLRDYWFESKNKGLTCCLCHGDYRANNILMKKDSNDEVTAVIPVDYQLLYYGCPVIDLLYFIFPCTDLEFRRKYLEDLKNLYYSSLTKFLAYFDMDAETIYPRHEYESTFKERVDHGLFSSLLLTPILFTEDNDIPDFSKDNVQNISVTPHPNMKERMVGLIDEFIEYGTL